MAADPIASTPDDPVESRILDYLRRELAGPEVRLGPGRGPPVGGRPRLDGSPAPGDVRGRGIRDRDRALGLRDRELQQRGRGCLLRRPGAVQDRRWRWPRHAAEAGSSDLFERSNLSRTQFLIWLGQEIDPDVPLYNMIQTFRIEGRLEPAAFDQAWQSLVRRSDALRTTVALRDGAPWRTVHDEMPAPVEVVDLRAAPDPDAAARRWVAERKLRPLRLGERLWDTALLRLADDVTVWYLCQHHLITDGQSFALVYRHVAEGYALALEGRTRRGPAAAGLRGLSRPRAPGALEPRRGEGRRVLAGQAGGTEGSDVVLREDRFGPHPAHRTARARPRPGEERPAARDRAAAGVPLAERRVGTARHLDGAAADRPASDHRPGLAAGRHAVLRPPDGGVPRDDRALHRGRLPRRAGGS